MTSNMTKAKEMIEATGYTFDSLNSHETEWGNLTAYSKEKYGSGNSYYLPADMFTVSHIGGRWFTTKLGESAKEISR